MHMCNTRHSLDHELLCAVGIYKLYLECGGFPGGSDSKESACSVGDPGLIPGWGRSLEKEMATHSSILAWRIPWTEKPGGPQSMALQRVGHD